MNQRAYINVDYSEAKELKRWRPRFVGLSAEDAPERAINVRSDPKAHRAYKRLAKAANVSLDELGIPESLD